MAKIFWQEKDKDGFQRGIALAYPFTCRKDKNKNEDYGIGTLGVFWYLKKDNKTVQFRVGQGMPAPLEDYLGLSGWDLGYHSPEPMYDGHEPLTQHCDVTGGACYYGGTGLGAVDFLKEWHRAQDNDIKFDHEEHIYAELKKWWHDNFGA